MTEDNTHFDDLFQLYLENKCSPEQLKALFTHIAKQDADKLVLQKLQEQFTKTFEEHYNETTAAVIQLDTTKRNSGKAGAIKLLVAAAAACIVIVGGYWLYNASNNANNTNTTLVQTPPNNSIQPGGNKATLTLANGEVVILDDIQTGTVAQQGSAAITKQENGTVAYNNLPTNSSAAVVMNTLKTPMGGQYHLVLADGTQVWLNAGSSIEFPSAFVGSYRNVAVTGEVYFEVAKNKEQPFKVQVNNKQEITVLGTHFNVMAYDNEQEIKATLIEGSIKIASGNKSLLLSPGQQAAIDLDGTMVLNENVNINHEIAWRFGIFDFENESLESIMRQMSRWYQVDVIYTHQIPVGHFMGSIKRSSQVEEVLEMLSLASDAKFKIDGKQIKVQ